MKVYVLYDNPYDERWNIYGIFSSEELLEKAIEEFTPYSNNELQWAYYELDDLVKFFDVNKQREYMGYSFVYFPLNADTLKWVDWKVHIRGLDSFLDKKERKDNIFLTSSLNFCVKADSVEDAINKANEMLKELINQPEDERGWKWLEK